MVAMMDGLNGTVAATDDTSSEASTDAEDDEPLSMHKCLLGFEFQKCES